VRSIKLSQSSKKGRKKKSERKKSKKDRQDLNREEEKTIFFFPLKDIDCIGLAQKGEISKSRKSRSGGDFPEGRV